MLLDEFIKQSYALKVVVSGQSVFGLEFLTADMAVHCLDRLLSKISIEERPFRNFVEVGRPGPNSCVRNLQH